MATRRKKPRRPGTLRQEAWWRSARFRQHARALALRNSAALARGPKCGARAKSTGEPCRRPAMKNGRCRHHGGRTPKGDNWHVVQLPNDPRSPASGQKRARKLRDRERVDLRCRQRKWGMTPEERAAHDAWHRAHPPGKASRRARARVQRVGRAETEELLHRPDPPKSAEMLENEKYLAEARAQLAAFEAAREMEEEQELELLS